MPSNARSLTPVVVVTLLALAGCGASAVSQQDVETQVLDGLSETLVDQVDDVTCPGDLPAEVDAQIVCELNGEKGVSDVEVTVTSVDGSDVGFDYDVKSTLAAQDVEEQVVAQLTEQFGEFPDGGVQCPEDLPGEVGAEIVCVLSAGGETIDVSVTVTSAEDGRAEFDIQVADEIN